MKQETRERKERTREEPLTLRDVFGQLFPPNIVDEILAADEKRHKQEEKGKGAKE